MTVTALSILSLTLLLTDFLSLSLETSPPKRKGISTGKNELISVLGILSVSPSSLVFIDVCIHMQSSQNVDLLVL